MPAAAIFQDANSFQMSLLNGDTDMENRIMDMGVGEWAGRKKRVRCMETYLSYVT